MESVCFYSYARSHSPSHPPKRFEISKRCPDFVPKKVLDYGVGQAPATAAACEMYPRKTSQSDRDSPTNGWTCEEEPVLFVTTLYEGINEAHALFVGKQKKQQVRAKPCKRRLILRSFIYDVPFLLLDHLNANNVRTVPFGLAHMLSTMLLRLDCVHYKRYTVPVRRPVS